MLPRDAALGGPATARSPTDFSRDFTRCAGLLPPTVPVRAPAPPANLVARALVALAAAWMATACSSPPTDDTPAGALRLFLDAIWSSEARDADDDREMLTTAYELLDAESREHLVRQARLAGALGGREREAWEMLAAGASRMALVPRRSGGMREVIDPDGRGATVIVSGESGGSAEVRLVREDDGWRVLLTVPEREGD